MEIEEIQKHLKGIYNFLISENVYDPHFLEATDKEMHFKCHVDFYRDFSAEVIVTVAINNGDYEVTHIEVPHGKSIFESMVFIAFAEAVNTNEECEITIS